MKKSIHIITNLTIGGAETMLVRVIKHKPDYVKSTIVISLMENGEIGRTLDALGVKVISMGMNKGFSILKTLFKIKNIIQIEKPDIIHTWMYHANILGGIAAYLAKNKNIVWSIRRSEYTQNESFTTFLIMKMGAIFSSIIPKVIVYVAESGLKNHQKYGYASHNSIVIPNGFDLEKLKYNPTTRKKIRNELNLNDDHIVIGCVGRFHVSKGYEILISSSVDILKSHKNVKYLLIGRNVDEQNRILMKCIDKTGFKNNFFVVGEKRNISDYMSAMDIFCLSSITEGFPNVLGEAMASELPCVATCVGDVQKITDNNAILVQPNNEKLLSKGLFEMINMNNDKRQRMGLIGRNIIEKNYSIRSICKKYYDLYLLILSEENNHKNFL